MANQLNATQRKIVQLAELQRADRSREAMFGDESRISFNTYVNFASGARWPRAKNIRVIEEILGWKPGVIDEVLVSDINPATLQLAHMTGAESLGGKVSIRDFSNAEYFEDLPRRIREVESLLGRLDGLALAASNDLGGIDPGEIEHS